MLRAALEINPDHKIAQNNLNEALKEKDKDIEKQVSSKEETIEKQTIEEKKPSILVSRAGIWEINTMNFKVKVQNNTKYSITDIKVILDKYPSMLRLLNEIVKTTPKIGPKGEFWSPEFKLDAGNDCLHGIVCAAVSYYDHEEIKRVIEVRPFEISYICPLLEATKIEEKEYIKKMNDQYSLEKKLIFERVSDLTQFKKEVAEKLEQMNLALVKVSSNQIIGYAVGKLNRDGLGLEAKIKEMFDGHTEIILKAICEREEKCPPLLYKAIQEIGNLGLEKIKIMQELTMFIEKPDDLIKYVKKIITSDWDESKKDRWATVVREILEDWKEFKPKGWEKIAKILLKIFLGQIVGDDLSGYFTSGIQNLFEWIKSNLHGA